MGYYPIAIDITDRACLIVGGGEIAYRKAKSLRSSGARVTVIAPEVDARFAGLDGVEVIRRPYAEGDAAGYTLVFAATSDRAVNSAIFSEANESGTLVNVIDDPELCSFIAPAVVRRGDLMLAVTSSGRSPMLSKRIRAELERLYGPEYEQYIEILGGLRDAVKAKYTTQPEREAVFARLLEGGILELIREGKTQEAKEKALQCI